MPENVFTSIKMSMNTFNCSRLCPDLLLVQDLCQRQPLVHLVPRLLMDRRVGLEVSATPPKSRNSLEAVNYRYAIKYDNSDYSRQFWPILGLTAISSAI